jgi:hypothetical protein
MTRVCDNTGARVGKRSPKQGGYGLHAAGERFAVKRTARLFGNPHLSVVAACGAISTWASCTRPRVSASFV